MICLRPGQKRHDVYGLYSLLYIRAAYCISTQSQQRRRGSNSNSVKRINLPRSCTLMNAAAGTRVVACVDYSGRSRAVSIRRKEPDLPLVMW